MTNIIDEAEENKRLRCALEFYADGDNYWSLPLSLDIPYCRMTLKAVRKSEEGNKVLSDRGKMAMDALNKVKSV